MQPSANLVGTFWKIGTPDGEFQGPLPVAAKVGLSAYRVGGKKTTLINDVKFYGKNVFSRKILFLRKKLPEENAPNAFLFPLKATFPKREIKRYLPPGIFFFPVSFFFSYKFFRIFFFLTRYLSSRRVRLGLESPTPLLSTQKYALGQHCSMEAGPCAEPVCNCPFFAASLDSSSELTRTPWAAKRWTFTPTSFGSSLVLKAVVDNRCCLLVLCPLTISFSLFHIRVQRVARPDTAHVHLMIYYKKIVRLARNCPSRPKSPQIVHKLLLQWSAVPTVVFGVAEFDARAPLHR